VVKLSAIAVCTKLLKLSLAINAGENRSTWQKGAAMAEQNHSYRELASKIRRAVEACIPTYFERSAARSALQAKIEAVLAEPLPAVQPEVRQVTILLADVRGFTALAETYSAPVIMEMLNRYFAAMTEVIIRFGGYIDKLMGDSIMVLFGAPYSEPDDTERAIACAVAMQQAMSEYNRQNMALGLPELYMGIGLNSGKVLAGALGSEHHRQYTVIGDEVNLASRIEAQSLRGQVLMSENCYQLAKAYVLVGQPNKVQVKGKRKPVPLYELLGTSRPRTMTVPRREIRKSPRVEVSMPCFFQVVDGKSVRSQPCRAEVLDIGYHGLLMVSPVPLPPMSEVKLQISLELLATDSADIYARVINSESVGDGFQCSLEFTAIDRAGQSAIKRYVDNLLFQA
jgi:adenylate cyclase